MTESRSLVETARPAAVAVRIVDTDVHPEPRSGAELRAHLPEPWRSSGLDDSVLAGSGAVSTPLYVPPWSGRRYDARTRDGGPPCSDPDLTATQLFGDAQVDLAVLIPQTVRPMSSPEHEAAVAAATNNWLASTWLSQYNAHGRYRGSITIGSRAPALAAREIERWAGHPYFVQVRVIPSTMTPLGQAEHYPVYEAAARHGLPVCLHVSRSAGMLGILRPVGFNSYYYEDKLGYCVLFATHLVSLLLEGVFERFPTLKVVLVEGGWGWLPPILWRLDRHWRELRSEVPTLRRRPSEYLRDHIRFTSQPVEEPRSKHQLAHVLEWMDAEHTLMFATDYPHWDGDYFPTNLFRSLPPSMRERIMHGNAQELYGLPSTRPGDGPAALH